MPRVSNHESPPTAPAPHSSPAVVAQWTGAASLVAEGSNFRTALGVWVRILAAGFARGLASFSAPIEQRAQGKPGARCTRGLACKIVQRNAHEHTGSAEAVRPSLRNGFTAYNALSPVTGLSCHRRWRMLPPT